MRVNVVGQGRMGKGVHMSTSVLIVQIDAGLIKIRVCKSRCWMLVGHTTRVFFFLFNNSYPISRKGGAEWRIR